jgi:C1A family cysteine protease
LVVVATGLLARGLTADPIEDEFEQWAKAFGKTYYEDAERQHRLQVFRENHAIVHIENAKNHTYELELNEFADQTADEFATTHFGIAKPVKVWGDAPYLGTHKLSGNAVPPSVDWTTKGAVTPVKNQGQCGSCWSFSTTGSLEGANAIATGKLVSLSEQEFVDCDTVDQGCNGGLMDNAFKYAEANAICTEESYPYKAQKGTCQKSSCTVGLAQGSVKGFKDVSPQDIDALMDAIAQQPVSIAIEADQSVFQLYKSGVLTGTCGTRLDHGVLAVGYGSLNGQDYWKVKNSWGPSWGLNGYILLEKGKSGGGECGIKMQPSYPEVSGTPGPAPGPSPPPPSPGCADAEDSFYCQLTKEQNFCDLLATDCLKTCGCCVASPPLYCNQASESTKYMKAREAVSSALRAIVV